MDDKREISLKEINSEAFIERLKANDTRAFHDLFTYIAPKLCSFLSADLKLSEADGDEIAANTMVKVNKSIAKFNSRGGAKLSTWIYRIAQNSAIDFIRQKKKQSETFRSDVSLDESVYDEVARDTAQKWFRENARRNGGKPGQVTPAPQLLRINRALDALGEQDRNLLLMRQSMEYEEIASAERVSVQTLRTRYSRAFERLCRELRKEESL